MENAHGLHSEVLMWVWHVCMLHNYGVRLAVHWWLGEGSGCHFEEGKALLTMSLTCTQHYGKYRAFTFTHYTQFARGTHENMQATDRSTP